MLKVYPRKLGDAAILQMQGRIVVGERLKTLGQTVVSQSNVSAIILNLARVNTIDAGGLALCRSFFRKPNRMVASLALGKGN